MNNLRYSDPKEYFLANPDEKVILGVDLDEVCFEYLTGFRNWLSTRGYEVPEGMPTTFSLTEARWFATSEEFKELHGKAVDEGLYKTLPVIPGASKNLWDLRNSGYEINIITSRFVVSGQHRKVVTQTAEAIDDANLPYSNISFLKNKMNFLADAYLDDGPHNITPLREAGRFVIRIHLDYNGDLGGPSADTWDESREILRERFGR